MKPTITSTEKSAFSRGSRIASLDFLRGVAILLVLFHHQPFFAPLQRFGFTGVDLFFVLSGFLVSGLLFSEYQEHGRVLPLRFLIRRGFKIYPGYYTLILVTIVVSYASTAIQHDSSKFLDIKALVAECFFLQNYLGGIYVHTWSLAVEEHFYIAVTIGLALAARFRLLDNKKLFPLLLIGMMLLCFLLRIVWRLTIPYDYETHFVPTHLRVDGLLFGVLISWWYHFDRLTLIKLYARGPLVLGLGIVATLAPALLFAPAHPFMYTVGFSLLYSGFGIVLIALLLDVRVEQTLHALMGKRLCGAIGRIGFYSYAIYLWHMFIIKYVLGFLDHRALLQIDYHLRFVLYATASIGLGILMAHLVEIPMLSIRNRYFPNPVQKKSPAINHSTNSSTQ